MRKLIKELGCLERRMEIAMNEMSVQKAYDPHGIYRFETFVTDPGNQKAYDACRHATGVHRSDASPLFLYGESGIGKTHLLISIRQYLEENTNLRVLYVAADDFLNTYRKLNSDANKYHLNKMRTKYMSTDVLLIDDIQYVTGNGDAQKFLFEILGVLHKNKKAIVITSDTAISQMKELDEAVRRYFDSEFSVEIKRPAYEARLRILMQLSVRTDYVIPDAVASYIAQYVQTNVWDLMDAFKKVYSVKAENLIDTRIILMDMIPEEWNETSKAYQFIEDNWNRIKADIRHEYELKHFCTETCFDSLSLYKCENNTIRILITEDDEGIKDYVTQYAYCFEEYITYLMREKYYVEFLTKTDLEEKTE